jgi:hypothetical protein
MRFGTPSPLCRRNRSGEIHEIHHEVDELHEFRMSFWRFESPRGACSRKGIRVSLGELSPFNGEFVRNSRAEDIFPRALDEFVKELSQ